jgi:UDP-N-acetylmuramoyl-L-alanyl-D-glutamate--2,6-diaminopimelate ligase
VREDGARYLADALARGAVCALCETAPDAEIPHVLVPDCRLALAQLAAAWYGEPAKRLTMIGVTGTNGKTTTAALIAQLLERTLRARVGVLGTVENRVGDAILPAERTTPGPLALHALLRRMVDAGCTHAVMEVSSHALVQRRTAGLTFDAAVFTNLTQDHLDYHGTMERYCDAKALLFRQCRAAAVNGDSRWAERVLAGADCPRLLYGQNLSNDLVGWQPRYFGDRVCFTVSDEEAHYAAELHIPGEFSLYNGLAALAAVRLLGVPLADAVRALGQCHGVRGRCEVVPTDTDYTVLIDYAHTPDGLKNILEAVCGFAENRVLLVFGCGGDRDRTKRARMGRIASALADLAVLTSDNPRTESSYAILHDVLAGMRGSATPFAVLENRREAIAYALNHAGRGDVVLLAGKGHETVQLVGTDAEPLDEREVVKKHLEQRRNHHADSAFCSFGLLDHGACGAVSDPVAAPPEGGAGDS